MPSRWMSVFAFVSIYILPFNGPALAVPAMPVDSSVVMDSTVRAFWHLDEGSGSSVGDETGINGGVANGTEIIPGVSGYARSFSGTADYIVVPSNIALDLDTSSFVVELKFKTSQVNGGTFIRRGISPGAGFAIGLADSSVAAYVGDSQSPYFLLHLVSEKHYNDDAWHTLRLDRDRRARVLSLFVDGELAAPPLNDALTHPLNTDRILTLGRWENPDTPFYFQGALDEIKILTYSYVSRFPKLVTSDTSVAFGLTRVGASDSAGIVLRNPGHVGDSLKISSIWSTSPAFSVSPSGPLSIAKGDSVAVRVRFSPLTSGEQSAVIHIVSNSADSAFARIAVSGAGSPRPVDSTTVVDSTLLAYWHFDEISGTSLLDETGKNTGVAIGTTIVPGLVGKARSFNGFSDYISVPSSPSLNLDTAGFAIECAFKTPALNGTLMRRGLAPAPGFLLAISNGKVFAQIGNRLDSVWPDTLITIVSDATFNDAVWHRLRLVRDRGVRKLVLYVDDTLAVTPVDDRFTLPLNSDRPLTFGAWEVLSEPGYIAGLLDEARIVTYTYEHISTSPRLVLSPSALAFGPTRVGSPDSLNLYITNPGRIGDSLKISSVSLSSSVFAVVPGGPMAIGKGDTAVVRVRYHPLASGKDSALIHIASNSSDTTFAAVALRGSAYVVGHAPSILSVSLVSGSHYQVHVAWIRSVDDTANAADAATQYSVWTSTNNFTWSPAGSIPAFRFNSYALDVPAAVDINHPLAWCYFVVIAVTKSGASFTSAADSIQPYVASLGVGEAETSDAPTHFALMQNYPNPFNPTTAISYQLPVACTMKLAIYDLLGRAVTTLFEGRQAAGIYNTRWDAAGLPSGVYLCRLVAGSFSATSKVLLMK